MGASVFALLGLDGLFLDRGGVAFRITDGLLLVGFAYIGWRSYRCATVVPTSTGIEVRGVFRSQVIAWGDVAGAELRRSNMGAIPWYVVTVLLRDGRLKQLAEWRTLRKLPKAGSPIDQLIRLLRK
jgi:Bacterial PH domain